MTRIYHIGELLPDALDAFARRAPEPAPEAAHPVRLEARPAERRLEIVGTAPPPRPAA